MTIGAADRMRAEAAGASRGSTPDLVAAALCPRPAPPGADPQHIADGVTAAARTSFGPAMRLLARPRRDAMRAIYALARIVDDIADDPALDAAAKLRLLDLWREEIAALAAGAPRSAIGRALAPAVARFALPMAEFERLLEAMAWDAAGDMVAPDAARLASYVRGAAGSIGLLSMRVFGASIVDPPRAEAAALALAEAFQLTNILRDLAEDAARGRLYLPRELLAGAGVPAATWTDPAAALAAPGLPRAAAALGEEAADAFRRARRAMVGLGRRCVAPALAMAGVYEGYLAHIARRGFRAAPAPAMRMGTAEKLARGLAALCGPIARHESGRD